MARIRLYEPYGYEEELDYQSRKTALDNRLEEIRENDVKEFSGISAIFDKAFTQAYYDQDTESIVFTNVSGETKAVIDAAELIPSDLITEAKYNHETQSIEITFKNGDEISIPVEDLIDIDEIGDGLQLVDGTVSVKVDGTSEEFLTVSSEGIKVNGIQDAIDAAVEAEKERAEAAESGLSEDIAAERERAVSAETSLVSAIASEVTNRVEADALLDAKITSGLTAEEERAEAAEEALDAKIDAEIERASEAEAVLKRDMDASDSALDNRITAEHLLIVGETARAEAAEEELSDRIDAIGGDISDLSDKVDALEEDVDAMSGEVADVRTEMDTVRSEFISLQTEVDELGGKVSSMNERVGAVEDGVATLSGKVDENSDSIETIESNLNELSGKVESFDTDLEAISGAAYSAVDIAESVSGEVETLTQEVDSLSDNLADVSSKVEANEEAIAVISGDVEQFDSRLDVVEDGIASLNTTVESVLDDIDSINDEISGLSSSLETVSGAVEELEELVSGLNYDDSAVTFNFVTEVDENNGLISVARKSIGSDDKTIVLTSNDGNVDLSVNVDGETIVKNTETGVLSVASAALTQYVGDDNTISVSAVDAENKKVISSNLTVVKVTTGLSANIKEEYHLVGSNGDKIGNAIQIYKDSSLLEVKSSTVDATWDSVTGHIVDGTGETAIVFAYQDASGTVELVAIPVSEIVQESIYKDGLQVSGAEVSVKIDETSDSFLSVSADGVKLAGVQDAIDAEEDRAVSAETRLTDRLNALTQWDGTDPSQYDDSGKTGVIDVMHQMLTTLANMFINDTLVRHNDYEVALGQYNVSNSDTVFSVGIGTDNENRKNAMEIRTNGAVYMWVEGEYVDITNVLQQLVHEIY